MYITQTANGASMRILNAVATCCVLLATFGSVTFAQKQTASSPRAEISKFDEFEDLKTDDELARLDLFAAELTKDQNLRGFIVGYRRNDFPVGAFLREVYGFQDYLMNKRGIAAERIRVVDSGIRENSSTYLTTQLWLVPGGADIPFIPAPLVKATKPRWFDSLSLGSGCVGEFTLVLEEPHDALRFFAQALQTDPEANGFVFIHPSRSERLSKATERARTTKATLTNNYRFPPEKIFVSLEARRPCTEIEFWLAPPNLAIPANTSPRLFLQSQLMAEAEQDRYSIRRVEFLGNAHVRDRALRSRIPGLQEGEIFTNAVLRQNLASLSRQSAIDPVSRKDVAAFLDRADKSIDLTIVVSERRRGRKQ